MSEPDETVHLSEEAGVVGSEMGGSIQRQRIETVGRTLTIGEVIRENITKFIAEVLPVFRIIASVTVTYILFIFADQAIFWCIDFTTRDLRSRIPYLALFFDGLQVALAVVTLLYFFIAAIMNIKTQWEVQRKIERDFGK